MKNEKTSFVFFGSGPVAAESLRQLEALFQVEAIITKPTTAREMSDASPGTPLFCVQNKAELDTLLAEEHFSSQCGVLIDFGIIVSNFVINSFPKGIINSHFSLLPLLRGADPISFALLEGHDKTGVSLMLVVEKMDEGALLDVKILPLNGTETTPLLTQSLIELSTSLLQKNLATYLEGGLTPTSQEEMAKRNGYSQKPTYTRKLSKEDGKIDWKKPAIQIEREVRAFSGWPKSYTVLNGIELVITEGNVIPSNVAPTIGQPGTYEVIRDKHQLVIICGEGRYSITKLKPAGKKEMTIEAFLAGYASRL